MLVFRARVRDHSLPHRRCRSATISRPCAGAEQRKNHFLRTVGLSPSSAIHELMSSGQIILVGVASPTGVFYYGKLALGIGSVLATPLGVGDLHKNREDHFPNRAAVFSLCSKLYFQAHSKSFTSSATISLPISTSIRRIFVTARMECFWPLVM